LPTPGAVCSLCHPHTAAAIAAAAFLAAHSPCYGRCVSTRTATAGFEQAGYRCVETVSERGEFARGSLVDVFHGACPYRIDLF
jgi:transcription-repair coupling factor (superfamily II helicase)